MSILARFRALFSPDEDTLEGRIALVAEGHCSSEKRIGLTDTEGVQLAGELDPASVRFPEELASARGEFSALLAAERPTDPEALAAWGQAYVAARRRFWEAFEGEVVSGVVIVRRRE